MIVSRCAAARSTAGWVNGGMTITGLHFEVKEQSKRHFEGVLNGGGIQITMNTVNGGVTVGAGLDESPGLRDGPAELPDQTVR